MLARSQLLFSNLLSESPTLTSSSDRNTPVPTLLIGPGQIVAPTPAKSAGRIGEAERMEGKGKLLPPLLDALFTVSRVIFVSTTPPIRGAAWREEEC
jgi:hypothetical protein